MAKPKYVALVTTPGSVVRVFGPWTSVERAREFQTRVNARIERIEESRETSRGRYGRVTLRAIGDPRVREALRIATDGLPS